MTSNEDFLFAQEATRLGFVTDAQVTEALELQRKLAQDLQLDERLAVLLVKRGYLAEEQARRVYATIQPDKGGPGQIHGYRLLEVLGRGAMGTVYRAVHLGLNREVAVKILRPDLEGDRTQIERLKAEAAMLASLDHPNIVRALDAGESNGFPYVVMELVEGETLRDRLRREQRLPEAEALRITRCLADALERARRMGVVHRDVKPGNVLLTRAGQPKLMDLGLAKGPIDLGLTQHGATVGTPQYISPEQALDPRKADTRSDIYSLGATLYVMLAGRPPFDGSTLAEILTKVLYEVPVPLRTLCPEVSPETGYLVERMMLRDPALRYRTPAQVVADIDRLTQGTSILPPGFTGNWEAFLVRKSVRRASIFVAVGVVGGLAMAVGVKAGLDWRRARADRDAVVARVDGFLGEHYPIDSLADIEQQLARATPLLAEARRVGSDGAGALGDRVRALQEERQRFRALADLLTGDVRRALDDGRFVEAHRALRRYLETTPTGAARRNADVRLREVAARSDDALAEARQGTPFPAMPRDAADVATAARAWEQHVVTYFVESNAQRTELERARAARRGAERLADAVAGALARVADAHLDEQVAARRFAEASDEIRRAREDAQAALREEAAALTWPEVRYVTDGVLAPLVAVPFAARRAALDDRVQQAWRTVRDEAFAKAEAGETEAALGLLDAIRDAASQGGAFPEIAQDARRMADEILAKTQEALTRARRELTALAGDVAGALAAGDLPRIETLLAEARARGDVWKPVEAGLADLERVVPTLRRLQDDAFRTIRAHRGRGDPSLWLPSLRFRDEPEPAVKVEILAVDEAKRSFDLQTHKGNGTQPHPSRRVGDIADDDLFALAGADRASPDGLWTLGVLAVAHVSTRTDDLYRPIAVLDEALGRFRAAGAEGTSPLARWAGDELARRTAYKDQNERVATDYLAAVQRCKQEGNPKGAMWYLTLLTDPAKERTLRLASTRVVQERLGWILEQKKEIEQEFNISALDRLWPVGGVVRRSGGPPDALDVTVTFDFNAATPLRAFLTAGWARVEAAPTTREVTPTPTVNRALRLLPGAGRETVGDRPIVWESPLAPTTRSIEFLYWALNPYLLAIDLDGVQVAILSDDPQSHELPRDVPTLADEPWPPRFDVAGTGRGVRFRAGTDLTDPSRWAWGDEYHGRRFVPPAVNAERIRSALGAQWFAFKSREKPYQVRLVWEAGREARLEIDGVTVHTDASAAILSPRPSGRLQILSMTECVIDDVRISGRIDPGWIARHKPEVRGQEPTDR